MTVPTAELERISTGAPTGYNNDPFNASTNPYGFDDGGYITNFFAALGDVKVVTTWSADTVAPIVAIATEIEDLGALTAQIEALGAQASNIAALGAISTDITTVAGISANVTAVASNVTAVTTVATDIAKVAAVAAIDDDVSTVAAAAGDISAIAGDVATLTAISGDIQTLADIEDGTDATDAIQTVAGIATAVSNVSDNSDDVVAVAGGLANVNTVAGISTDVTAVAAIDDKVGAVADIAEDVETAADNIAAIVAAPAAALAARKSVRHALFDTNTADSHPGAGHFKFSFDINAASPGTSGTMYQDIADADGGDITGWLESFDDVINSTGRGNITLVGEDDPSVSATLRVTGSVTNGTSYRKIPVYLLVKSPTFSDEDEFTQTFQPYGNDAGGGSGSGDVTTTGSVTSGRIAQFADGTGDVLEDSGKSVGDFFDLGANTLDDVPDGTTNKGFTSTEKTKLSGIEAAADVTDAGNVGSTMAGVSTKATPVDADGVWITDSADSNAPKRALWSAVKATLKTYFDTLYSAIGHTHTFSSLTSKPTTVSGYGITDAPTLTGSETLTNKTLTTPVLTLEQGTSVAPTAEGRIAWDTDDNKLKIGDGSGTKTFSDDSVHAATYQPIDTDLTAIAGLASAANKIPYATGSGTWALADFPAAARTALTAGFSTDVLALLDDANFAAMRTSLGLAIGTNVQAYDADLTTWSAVARASGFDTFVETPSSANLAALVSDETGSGSLVFSNAPAFTGTATGATFHLSGNLGGNGATSAVDGDGSGTGLYYNGQLSVKRSGNAPVIFANRIGSDGLVYAVNQDGTQEGGVQVSGTTVSISAATIAHWGQLEDGSRPDILVGTIMETIDDMSQWLTVEYERDGKVQHCEQAATSEHRIGDEVEIAWEESAAEEAPPQTRTATGTVVPQKKNYLPRVKVSDTAGSRSVCGLFMFWDGDWDQTNDINYAGAGTYKIRIASDQNPVRGDLIESNGDGTGRVQADDVIRAATVAKISAAVVLETYPDGSKLMPCYVLCA